VAFGIARTKAQTGASHFYLGYAGIAYDNDEQLFETAFWAALDRGLSVGAAFDLGQDQNFSHALDADWWGTYGWSGQAGAEVLLNQGPGLSAWVPAPGDLGGGHRSRAFGSLEPVAPAPASAGRLPRVAVVEGDPGLGGPGRLVIETAAGVVVGQVSLASVPESAPGWLPDGRVAVVVRDGRDQPTVRLADPTSGRISLTSGAAVRSIAIAGGIIATIGVDGAARAGPVTSWPAGGPLPVVAGGDGEVVLQAQPSPSGRELAVVVADVDGDAGSIRILAAAAGWHEIARFGLPSGANRAVVSWLAAW
jgi:hypothetical protein